MGKRMGTYRVDEDLLAAVAAKAAVRGETVTDLIIERFHAYIRDDEAAGIVSAPLAAEPTVYTDAAYSDGYDEPAAVACKHPAEAVEAGECRNCGADVW